MNKRRKNIQAKNGMILSLLLTKLNVCTISLKSSKKEWGGEEE